MRNIRFLVHVFLMLMPSLAGAQTNCVLRAGESVEIPVGHALVFINVYQSGMRSDMMMMPMGSYWAPSGRDFQCRVEMGGLDIPVQIQPLTLRVLGPYSAVLAGPARLTVTNDSLITHRMIQSPGLRSHFATNGVIRSFDIPQGKLCRFFIPLTGDSTDLMKPDQKGYDGSESLDGQIRVLGTTITNSSFYPPFEIAGPAVLDLGKTNRFPDLNPTPIRYIVTTEILDAETVPIVPGGAQGSIEVESSNDMVNWKTILSTNQFLGGKGFYRLRN